MATYKYRDVVFKIEAIGADIWRWTVFPHYEEGLSLIGQAVGPVEEAIAECRMQIDRLLDKMKASQ